MHTCFNVLSPCFPHSKQKQSQDKLSQIKRNQQTEKKNSAQLLEEARQRENSMTEDMTKIQVHYYLQ